MGGVEQVFTINTAPEDLEKQWSDINAFPGTDRHRWPQHLGSDESQACPKSRMDERGKSWESTSRPRGGRFRRWSTKRQQAPERQDGNPELAFAGAAQTIERTYAAPFP